MIARGAHQLDRDAGFHGPDDGFVDPVHGVGDAADRLVVLGLVGAGEGAELAPDDGVHGVSPLVGSGHSAAIGCGLANWAVSVESRMAVVDEAPPLMARLT